MFDMLLDFCMTASSIPITLDNVVSVCSSNNDRSSCFLTVFKSSLGDMNSSDVICSTDSPRTIVDSSCNNWKKNRFIEIRC